MSASKRSQRSQRSIVPLALRCRTPNHPRGYGFPFVSLLDQIRERLTIITLDEKDYCSAIASAVTQGVVAGTIYDALLAQCALKANATTIYTWNLDHFRLLGPEVARRARTP